MAKSELIAWLYEEIDRTSALAPKQYSLTPDAFKLFCEAYNSLERRRIDPTTTPAMQNVWGKSEGRIGKLAINLHRIEAAFLGQPPSPTIGRNTIKAAIALSYFSVQQVQAIYTMLGSENSLPPMLAKVLDIAERKGDWITSKDVQSCFNSKNRPRPETIRQWFKELQVLSLGTTEGSGRYLKFLLNSQSGQSGQKVDLVSTTLSPDWQGVQGKVDKVDSIGEFPNQKNHPGGKTEKSQKKSTKSTFAPNTYPERDSSVDFESTLVHSSPLSAQNSQIPNGSPVKIHDAEIPNSDCQIIDWNELLEAMDEEMKRLCWGADDGHAYLQHKYHKKSRHALTDSEALEFYQFLTNRKTGYLVGERTESETDLSAARATGQAIRELQPEIVTVENVVSYRDSQSWQLIRETLTNLGYNIQEATVNAADYGVPQKRQRFLAIAVLQEQPPELLGESTQGMGWMEAIADLIPTLPESQLADWQQQRIPSIEPGKAYLIERTGARKARDLLVRAGNDPSWTIKANIATDQKGANRHDPLNALLPDGKVVSLNARALARLQSVPDWYQLPEPIGVAVTLIGNGVPCLLAEALMKALSSSELGVQKNKLGEREECQTVEEKSPKKKSEDEPAVFLGEMVESDGPQTEPTTISTNPETDEPAIFLRERAKCRTLEQKSPKKKSEAPTFFLGESGGKIAQSSPELGDLGGEDRVFDTSQTSSQKKSETPTVFLGEMVESDRLKTEPITISTNSEAPVLMVESDHPQTKSTTISTPSQTKRSKSQGTGRIQWRTVTKKNGRQYQQAWYDWQMTSGDKTLGKSTYIPKRLLARVQELDASKAPVREVLMVLGVGSASTAHGGEREKYRTLDKKSPKKKSEAPTFFLGEISAEEGISIPCVIKQPGQPELRGVIVADTGGELLVLVNNSDNPVLVPKLWVFPDFSKLKRSPVVHKSPKKNPSGHLSPVIQRKKDKSGQIVEYPKVDSERVPIDLAWEYPHQFFWLYNWSVKENGCWKNKSKSVPRNRIWTVRSAIATNKPVSEILSLIEE